MGNNNTVSGVEYGIVNGNNSSIINCRDVTINGEGHIILASNYCDVLGYTNRANMSSDSIIGGAHNNLNSADYSIIAGYEM